MFVRSKAPLSDRRPPPLMPGAPSLGQCVRCGLDVAPTDGIHGLSGVEFRHFVCDPALRSGVTRRIEAMRALHRALAALSHLPLAKAQLENRLADLPDVADVGQILELLGQVRVSVECTAGLPSEQRRLALSYLDALLRKLAAS